MKTAPIAVLGAGSWGTAVAIHLARCGYPVFLWGHRKEHVEQMQASRSNERYLSGMSFPQSLKPSSDLSQCIENCTTIILAVPSHAFSEVFVQINKPLLGIAWLTKGLEPIHHRFFSQLVAERWGAHFPMAVISGPSFAREVAQSLPTALTLASNNTSYQKHIQLLLHQKNIRVYLSHDMIGVQLCGAIKNVLAIACGISDGLGYGSNAKAALITRGLAEMRRLSTALGGKEETCMGLAGVGDLVLTCTDNQSRNRRFGLYLGQNNTFEEAERKIGQVVEGRGNALQVQWLADQARVEMPICAHVNKLLERKISAEEAVKNLMTRAPKVE